MSTHVYKRMSKHMSTHMFTDMSVHILIHVYTRVRTHVLPLVCKYVYAHAYTHVSPGTILSLPSLSPRPSNSLLTLPSSSTKGLSFFIRHLHLSCVRACERACERASVRASVCACLRRVHTHTYAHGLTFRNGSVTALIAAVRTAGGRLFLLYTIPALLCVSTCM